MTQAHRTKKRINPSIESQNKKMTESQGEPWLSLLNLPNVKEMQVLGKREMSANLSFIVMDLVLQ